MTPSDIEPIPDPLDMQRVQMERAAADDILAAARGAYDSALGTARDSVARPVDVASAAATRCRSLSGASAESCIDRAMGALATVVDKWRREVISRVGGAYEAVAPFGYVPPDGEHLTAAKATGRIAGVIAGQERLAQGESVPGAARPAERPEGCDARTIGVLTAALAGAAIEGRANWQTIIPAVAGPAAAGWLEYFRAAVGILAAARGGPFVTVDEAVRVIRHRCENQPAETFVPPPPRAAASAAPPVPPEPPGEPAPGEPGAPPPGEANGQPVDYYPIGLGLAVQSGPTNGTAPPPAGRAFLDRGIGFTPVPYEPPRGAPPGTRPTAIPPGVTLLGTGKPSLFSDVCGPTLEALNIPPWGKENVCELVEAQVKKLEGGFSDILEAFGFKRSPEGGWECRPEWAQMVYDGLPWGLSDVWDVLAPLPFQLISFVMRLLPAQGGCETHALIPSTLSEIVLGFIDRHTGGAIWPWIKGLDYLRSYICPVKIPSPPEADQAYLSGAIDKGTWECWTRANGEHVYPRERGVEAMRTRPNASQVADLWLRGFLTKEEYHQRSREAGVLNDEDRRRIEQLAYEFPHLDDIVRFMVRDVFDQKVVDDYGLMGGFDEKYVGQAKDWARGRGVPDDVFAKYWAAHWRYPSDTQAEEMLHRLQPGFPGVPKAIEMREADLQKLYEINDVAPGWRDRLMAISWKRLTRIDVKQAYTNGALTDDEAEIHLRKYGYVEADAKTLLKVWTVARQRRDAAQLGALSVKEVVKSYQDLLIDRLEATGNLKGLGLSDQQIEDALDSADKRRAWQERRAVWKTMRKGYISGALVLHDMIERMAKWGVPAAEVAARAQVWDLVRLTGERNPTAAQLCDWHTRAMISSDEYYTRLLRIGFGPEDATRTVQVCDAKFAAKRAAELKKLEEKEAKAAAAAAKAAAAAAKAQAKAAAAALKAGAGGGGDGDDDEPGGSE